MWLFFRAMWLFFQAMWLFFRAMWLFFRAMWLFFRAMWLFFRAMCLGKARNTAFENGIALGEFLFEMFSVTTKSEGLTVPVLLVTGSAGGCTSGASWVLTVRIGGRGQVGEPGNCRLC
ncbi:hypothetical protein EDB83DRAFT_2314084 [Lactarius deliciosus]|nr:hypothetical protein EDB83DRAFT_2314084 [Lactarius deliciosus]